MKDDNIHVVNYADEKENLLKSNAVNIDFYMLTLKPMLHSNFIRKELWDDQSNSYIYIGNPYNSFGWETERSSSGYTIMISSSYLKKLAKDFSFLHYNSLPKAIRQPHIV